MFSVADAGTAEGLESLCMYVLNARQYTVGFANSYLLCGVVAALRTEGFISDALAGG